MMRRRDVLGGLLAAPFVVPSHIREANARLILNQLSSTGGQAPVVGYQSYNDAAGVTTWDPAKNGDNTLSDDDLKSTSGGSGHQATLATLPVPADKQAYWELTLSEISGNLTIIGTGTDPGSYGNSVGGWEESAGNGYNLSSTNPYYNGFSAFTSNEVLTNDTWGFALDTKDGIGSALFWIRNGDGDWLGGGDPVARTSPTTSRISGTGDLFAALSHLGGGAALANFGATAFVHGLPA